MPEDGTAADGTSQLPRADYRTPMRVECFMNLVSPNLATGLSRGSVWIAIPSEASEFSCTLWSPL